MDRRQFLGMGLVALSFFAVSPSFGQSGKIFTGIISGVAVGGYDPVAYFQQGEAVKGNPEISLEYLGANWRFSSLKTKLYLRPILNNMRRNMVGIVRLPRQRAIWPRAIQRLGTLRMVSFI